MNYLLTYDFFWVFLSKNVTQLIVSIFLVSRELHNVKAWQNYDTQILREINIHYLIISKSAHLTFLGTLNFKFSKFEFYPGSKFTKVDFT